MYFLRYATCSTQYYRYDDEDDSNVELDEDCVLYPPLHLASENGQAMVVQKLLTKYKADPNAKNAVSMLTHTVRFDAVNNMQSFLPFAVWTSSNPYSRRIRAL